MPPSVSHEEPDIEVPAAKLERDNLDALEQGGGPPSGTSEVQLLRGDLTPKAIAAGILVAVLMGASYPYMVLKLGFGPNVSVVAAFFGFLFLRLFDIVGGGKPHYNRWQNNLAEAAGTSAAQTAFMCVLLGAFEILKHNTGGEFGMELTPIKSFFWLTAACTLGVLMAVPLRRHFVVDENLPYVDGMATAETIVVMDPPVNASATIKKNALVAFRAVMWGVGLSGLLMFVRDDAHLADLLPDGWSASLPFFDYQWIDVDPKGWLVMAQHGYTLGGMGVGFSYSLLSIGSGMIVGLRINLSMMLGGVLAWIVAPYFLVKYGVALHHEKVVEAGQEINRFVFTDAPKRTEVLFWVMWPATGMLVVGGLTALALRWKLLVETFRSLRKAKIGSDEMPLSVVAVGVAASAIALCGIQAALLDMPVWMTLVAIVLSVPLMLVGLRVLGETNWGPISALSNMMQGVFAALAPGNVGANMVASGTTGTIATSSEAIMQDYKCGEMIGTRPRNLTIMQLIAVPVGAAAVSWGYPVLVNAFGIVDKVAPDGTLIPAQLTSPISNKWSGFAQILKEGVGALPTSALYALLIFSILGCVFTVLESTKWKNFVPSPTGVGIGILVPFQVVSTMFVGGLIGYFWEKKHKQSADVLMVPLASGFIAGEALVAVLGSIYLALTT